MRKITSDYGRMTFDDYMTAFSRTTSTAPTQWSYGITALVSVIVGLLLDGAGQIIAIGTGALLAIAAIRAPKLIRRSWARHYMQSENYSLFGEARGTVDDSGILCEFRSGRYEFTPWNVIKSVEDVAGLRLLLTGQNTAVMLPRRAFEDDDWREFNAFIRQRFPRAKLSLD